MVSPVSYEMEMGEILGGICTLGGHLSYVLRTTYNGHMRIALREKRQITLPASVCEELGLEPGDQLEVDVEDGSLVIRPARKAALDALKEIQRAFASAGLTEQEWQDEARNTREELVRERWPDLFAHQGTET